MRLKYPVGNIEVYLWFPFHIEIMAICLRQNRWIAIYFVAWTAESQPWVVSLRFTRGPLVIGPRSYPYRETE